MQVAPVTLVQGRVRLVPMTLAHEVGLRQAAADGALWQIRVTSVPEPDGTRAYIDKALAQQLAGDRLPFVVLVDGDGGRDEVVGTTSYHDIVPRIDRLEIGYTWYAKRYHRSFVNTTCKLLLMQHAFEALDAQLVGWRTDCENFASQAAIERLGARKDGVLRHHMQRRDGTVRDTVMYSMRPDEWPAAKARLVERLNR